MATVAIKLVPLAVVIVIAAVIVGTGEPTAAPTFNKEEISLSSINAAAALTLWAMLSFEVAAVSSRNVRDPARTIPRATIIGTLVAGLIYLLVATPVTLFLPQSEVAASNAPFALFVGHYWSPTFGNLIGLFAAISAIGALNGLTLVQGEMPLAMARDGTFPKWFAKTTANGVALRAQLLSTAATLILYLSCALAAGRLQLRGRLGGPWIVLPIVALASIYSMWTLYGAGTEPIAWGALLLIIGIPVYFGMRLNSLWSSPAPAAAQASPPESSP